MIVGPVAVVFVRFAARVVSSVVATVVNSVAGVDIGAGRVMGIMGIGGMMAGAMVVVVVVGTVVIIVFNVVVMARTVATVILLAGVDSIGAYG